MEEGRKQGQAPAATAATAAAAAAAPEMEIMPYQTGCIKVRIFFSVVSCKKACCRKNVQLLSSR